MSEVTAEPAGTGPERISPSARTVNVKDATGAEHQFTVAGDSTLIVSVDGREVLSVDRHGPGPRHRGTGQQPGRPQQASHGDPEADGRYRVADPAAAAAWLARQVPSHGHLYYQDCAALVRDAVDVGVIDGGLPGTSLGAETCTGRDGTPDCWRVLVYIPALDCCLLSDPETETGFPDGLELLQRAADAANALLGKASRAGLRGGNPDDEPGAAGRLAELAGSLGVSWLRLGELVHDVASGEASEVSNGGVPSQVAYLVREAGAPAAERMIREAAVSDGQEES